MNMMGAGNLELKGERGGGGGVKRSLLGGACRPN